MARTIEYRFFDKSNKTRTWRYYSSNPYFYSLDYEWMSDEFWVIKERIGPLKAQLQSSDEYYKEESRNNWENRR
jgi:hypothetical protein